MTCPIDPQCTRYPCRDAALHLSDDPKGGCDHCSLGNCPPSAERDGWPCPCAAAVEAAELQRAGTPYTICTGCGEIRRGPATCACGNAFRTAASERTVAAIVGRERGEQLGLGLEG